MSKSAKQQKSPDSLKTVLGRFWVFPANQSRCPECPFLSTEVYQTKNVRKKVRQSFLYYNVPGKLEHLLLHTNPNKENPNQFFKFSLERKKRSVANFKESMWQTSKSWSFKTCWCESPQTNCSSCSSFRLNTWPSSPKKNRPPQIAPSRLKRTNRRSVEDFVATLGQNSMEVVKIRCFLFVVLLCSSLKGSSCWTIADSDGKFQSQTWQTFSKQHTFSVIRRFMYSLVFQSFCKYKNEATTSFSGIWFQRAWKSDVSKKAHEKPPQPHQALQTQVQSAVLLMLPKLPWRLQKSLGFCCCWGKESHTIVWGRKNTNWQTTQGLFCCSSLLLLESLTCFFTCFCAYDETHWNPNVIWQCQHTRPSSQLGAFQVALTNLASEQKSTCTSWTP